MSFANSLRRIALEYNAGLQIFRRNLGLKSTCRGATLDFVNCKDVSHLMQPLSLTLCKSKAEKFCITFPQPDVTIKKNIVEPTQSIKISFELPIRSSTDKILDLPFHIEKEIKDPPVGKTISKRATHMIIIRRRKMRRHKYKKYLKKNKILIAKRKLQRSMAKEAQFQLSLQNTLSEIDNYSAEKYVDETLKKVHWKRPITSVRGYLAPDWVIKKHLADKERKKIIWERIEECSK